MVARCGWLVSKLLSCSPTCQVKSNIGWPLYLGKPRPHCFCGSFFCFGFLKKTAQTSAWLPKSSGLTASLGAEGWKNPRIQFSLRGA